MALEKPSCLGQYDSTEMPQEHHSASAKDRQGFAISLIACVRTIWTFPQPPEGVPVKYGQNYLYLRT